jgi:hypothetical protein
VGGDLGDGFALRPESLPTPGTFVEISGIPFLCTAKADGPNTLDVSKTAYRGGRGTAAGEQRLDAATCRAPWRQPAPAPLRRAPARQPHRGPAGASRLGAWVCGNGAAWVDLELEDAEGNRWTTVRPPLLYDFGVQYRGPHAFDGWRYVAYPLTAPAEKKDWPDHFRCGDRTGPPALPARLTAVVVQQYAEILHINRLVPPSPETWRIGEILAD